MRRALLAPIALVAACGGSAPPPPSAATIVVPPGAATARRPERAAARASLGTPGSTIFARRYGDGARAAGVAVGRDDRIALVGRSHDALFVAWLDAEGAAQSRRAYGMVGILGTAFVVAAPDGDVVVAGRYEGELAFDAPPITSTTREAYVARLHGDGAARWVRRFGGAVEQQTRDVAVAPSGDLVVVGEYRGGAIDLGKGRLASATSKNAFVGVLAPDGTTRWARGFGAMYGTTAVAAAVDRDGNVFVAGEFDGTLDVGAGPMKSPGPAVAGRGASWIAKLAPDGRALWSRTLAGSRSVTARDLAVDRDGNVFVAGLFSKTLESGAAHVDGNGHTDGFVAALDRSGATRWAKRVGTEDNTELEQVDDVAVDRDGNLLVAGARTATKDGMPVYGSFVASVDPSGAPRWSRWLPHANVDVDGHALALDASGRAILAGSFTMPIDFGTGAPLDPGPKGDAIFVAAIAP